MLGGAELVEQSKNVHMNGLKVKILCVPTNCPQQKKFASTKWKQKCSLWDNIHFYLKKSSLGIRAVSLSFIEYTLDSTIYLLKIGDLRCVSVLVVYFFSILLPLAPQSFSRLFISLPLRVLDVNQFNNRARTSLCPIIQWISKTMGHQRQEKRHLFSFFISYL